MRSSILLLVVFIVSCVPLQPIETQVVVPTLSKTPVPSKTLVPTLADTSTPTITPVLTFTPSPTSTLQPPLAAHEWKPEIVLISMRENIGDGGVGVGDLGPPPFILYADGSLFITQYIYVDDFLKRRVLVKKLNREDMCKHLNTLDQIGYLDYDSSDYTFIGGEPNSIGGPSINIVVNAWTSKLGRFYDLDYYLQNDTLQELYGQNGYPIISPALRDTYYFLREYPISGFEVYKPDRLGVWIAPVQKKFIDNFNVQAKDWTFTKIPLIPLINKAEMLPDNYQKFIILNAPEAQLLYDYFGNLFGANHFFIEDPKAKDGKEYYEVFVRPLLPYEIPGEYHTGFTSTIPAPDAPKPNFKLTCYPSDGVLSIPIPPRP